MHLSLSMKMLFFFTEISFSRDMRLSCRSFSEFSAWFSWFFRASIDWQISFTSPTNLKQTKQHMSEAPRLFFFSVRRGAYMFIQTKNWWYEVVVRSPKTFFFFCQERCLHVYPDQKLVIWSRSENFAVVVIKQSFKTAAYTVCKRAKNKCFDTA